MKNIIISGIVIIVIVVTAPQIVSAQGTINYLSSLGPASTSTDPVGSDYWLAAGFTTGINAGGYVLNSVQLAMTDASGNPNGFTAMLYSGVSEAGSYPGSSLGILTGSADPITANTYTYTAPPTLTLSPHTLYYMVLTASTPVADGAYEWSVEDTVPPYSDGSPDLYGWYEDNAVLDSSDSGSLWAFTSYTGIAQFAVNATAAPEPGFLSLFAVGALFLVRNRWKSNGAE